MNVLEVLHEIQGTVNLKKNKIHSPSNYLGARLKQKSLDGSTVCTITCVDYFNSEIKNVEEVIRGSKSKFII